MTRSAATAAAVLICTLLPGRLVARAAQDLVVLDVIVNGAHEVSDETILEAAGVERGRALPVPADRVGELADRVRHAYKDEGYTFATVAASFDAATNVLTFTVDEGVIGEVEFTGVDDRLKHVFVEQFALRGGDVFNRKRARQALDVLLEQTRGAVRRDTFDLVEKNGEKVLLVGLDESAGRFKIVPDLGEREDWFTAVDGFVPSLGMGAAVFDHENFNHA